MRYHLLAVLVVCALIYPAAAQQPAGTPQPSWKAKNLKFFPPDITRAELTQRMREFSFALGVRCQYCHAGGDGISFDGVDFSSDEKPAKLKARAMLQMTAEINSTLLAKVPSRAEPRVEVNCATCHRGLNLPKSLQDTLLQIIDKDGVDAAVTRFRELRKDTTLGRYNMGEWEVMELARRLAEQKKTSAAIAILQMNGEYYPKAGEIDFAIAELLRDSGEKEKALARYKTSLEKNPENRLAKQRIAELEKKMR